VDAPEMPSSPRKCRYTQKCPKGNAYTSKDATRRYVRGSSILVEDVDKDNWGRRIANVKAVGRRQNLSCYLVENGYAQYRGDWDRKNGMVLRKTCSYVRRNYRWDGSPAK
jgi:endonuclease YncB( thermonuclease family)